VTRGIVAVFDVGKTNLKVLLSTDDGHPVDQLSRPNDASGREPYLAIDIEAIEAWFLEAVADLGRRHPIDAIIATGHGCASILCDDAGPVLPMMDYEAPCPAWVDEAYRAEWPGYGEVACMIGPGAMRPAKQMLWQSIAFPEAFAKARYCLTTSQYLAFRLGGRPAAEISQMAAQCHLWNVPGGTLSSIVQRRGWAYLFPSFARAGDVLGTLSPALCERTGLALTTKILCGVHDSNANLFRYKAAGLADRDVFSTGTWMIGFSRDKPVEILDERRAMVCNLDVDGEPVVSTLTMTGREYALIAGAGDVPDDAVMAAIPGLIARGTLALPSFVEDDGPFPGSSRAGRVEGPPPGNPAERRALAALYAAFTADLCLDSLQSGSPVVVDGGFAANQPFGRILAALRPSQPVAMSRARDGTALGAALLWKRFERTEPVDSVALEDVTAIPIPGLREAAMRWRALGDAMSEASAKN
jgi:sugar (pentulose or hexulose) kinase